LRFGPTTAQSGATPPYPTFIWGAGVPAYPIAKAIALDLDSKSDKAKFKGLIKVWLKAGNLIMVEEKDDHREVKKFVKVAGDD
jgi:hypothetical protein